MNKFKKLVLLASFIFLLNACSPETKVETETEKESQVETKQETETETETEKETEIETDVETETEKETQVETQAETEKETQVETETETQAETNSDVAAEKLNAEDQEFMKKIITDIDKFPHGTAGSSIKFFTLFSELVNNDELFKNKFDSIVQFAKENISLITDKENANQTLKNFTSTIEQYKRNPEEIKNTLESSTDSTIKLDGDVIKIQEFIEVLKTSIQ